MWKRSEKKAVIDILEGFKDWKFNVGARGEKIKVSFSFLSVIPTQIFLLFFCVHKNGRKEILKKLSYFFFLLMPQKLSRR